MPYSRSEILDGLHNHVCEIVFTKKSGEVRTLRGTLRQDLIESNNLVPVGGGSSYPDTQIRLIDLDKKEWRSFNIDTVSSFAIIEDAELERAA